MKRLSFILLISVLVMSGCSSHEHKEKKVSPAKVESRAGEATPRVILTAEADKRLGVEVTPIEGTQAFPASSLLYDLNGKIWVYVRESAQTYHRIAVEPGKKSVRVEVVTQGAAELYGTESGVGK